MFPGKKYKPEDFLHIAWRRKWLIVAVFTVVTAAGIVVSRFLPNQYRSESLIQIVPQRVPESYVRSTVTSRIEDRLQSLRQQVLNRTRLERIMDDFKLFAEERKTRLVEDLVEQVRSHIDIEIVKGDAFKVSYTAGDPKTAMQVTERLASWIIEENLRDRESLAEGANQFFETQLDDSRARLVERERKLEEYRRLHAGELPSQLEANLTVVHNTQMQLQSLRDSVNRDRDQRLLLERQLDDLSGPEARAAAQAAPEGSAQLPAETGTTAEQVEAGRATLRLLLVRLTEQHPEIVRLKRAIAELEAKEAAEQTGAVKPRVQSPAELAKANRLRNIKDQIDNIDRQIAYRTAEQAALEQQLKVYHARAEATPTRESELVALTRDYDTLQKIYTNLLSKKEDANVAANLERRQIGEQFKVLDPARLPERAASPNRLQINLLAALVGLVLGCALVTLLEYFDSTLSTDDDVTAGVGLPVLAVVPMAITMTVQTRRQRWQIVSNLTAAATVVSVLVLAWRFGS